MEPLRARGDELRDEPPVAASPARHRGAGAPRKREVLARVRPLDGRRGRGGAFPRTPRGPCGQAAFSRAVRPRGCRLHGARRRARAGAARARLLRVREHRVPVRVRLLQRAPPGRVRRDEFRARVGLRRGGRISRVAARHVPRLAFRVREHPRGDAFVRFLDLRRVIGRGGFFECGCGLGAPERLLADGAALARRGRPAPLLRAPAEGAEGDFCE